MTSSMLLMSAPLGGADTMGLLGIVTPKCRSNPASAMAVARAFPSAEYPAICGVATKVLSSNSRLIFGSFSQQSMAAFICDRSRKRDSAPLSTTPPRALLSSNRHVPNLFRKFSSARCHVGFSPAFVNGVWNVMISASRAMASSATNAADCSLFAEEGRSEARACPIVLPNAPRCFPRFRRPPLRLRFLPAIVRKGIGRLSRTRIARLPARCSPAHCKCRCLPIGNSRGRYGRCRLWLSL